MGVLGPLLHSIMVSISISDEIFLLISFKMAGLPTCPLPSLTTCPHLCNALLSTLGGQATTTPYRSLPLSPGVAKKTTCAIDKQH